MTTASGDGLGEGVADRDIKPDNYSHDCAGCGFALYKGYPFTVCDDCWWHPMADRIAGALLALSRVAVWMAMEARHEQWTETMEGFRGDMYSRAEVLGLAVRDGRLRLTYPETP